MENHFSCCLALAYRSAWLANEFALKTNTTTTAFLTIYHLVFHVSSTILVHSVTILVFHFQPFWSTCVCLLSTVTQLGCTDFLHFGALFHLPLPRYLSNFAGILFHIICGGLADLYRMLVLSFGHFGRFTFCNSCPRNLRFSRSAYFTHSIRGRCHCSFV